MRFSFILLACTALTGARFISKRDVQNSYGDEPTPAPLAESHDNDVVSEVPTEAPTEAPVEETTALIDNGPSHEHEAVSQSGYRKRRDVQNSYGDENVDASTEAPVANDVPTDAPVEETTALIDNGAHPEEPVSHSGYRKRRDTQNSYGDEVNAPADASIVDTSATEAPFEETTALIDNGAAAAVDPVAVTPSGYRVKREDVQNSYGDEHTDAPIEATEAPVEEHTEVPAEETTALIDNGAHPAEPVAQSGY